MCGLFAASVLACGLVVPGQHQVPGSAPASVGQLVVGPLRDVATFGTKEAPGEPTRLAWSADGAYLYVRASTFDRWANETTSHLLVAVATGRVERLAAEPPWAAQYWSWKSGPTCPADASFRVDLEVRSELVRTTNVPREGNIGQNVADPAAGLDDVVINAARASQQARFETLTLRGRVIDRAVNRHLVPGRTFGWAPAPSPLVAYVDEKGRLAVMDAAGRTRGVEGAKQVVLPAWSGDATRLAFLRKTGGGKFSVRIADLAWR